MDRFAMLGMAQGARIGMAYAAAHPDRISRLVLYQPSTGGRGAPGLDSGQARGRADAIQSHGAGLAGPRSGLRPVLHVDVRRFPGASSEQVRAYSDLLRQTTSPATAMAMQRSFHMTDVRTDVPKCPLSNARAAPPRTTPVVPFDEGRTVTSLH